MPGVFISYRREDSAGHTGRLFDRLRARLGHDRVFMDITGIEAGVDFVDTIERAIGSCDVLLAVIGSEWQSCADARGRPRLEDPADLIRVEIAAALTRNVRVIPVLIAGASMPSAASLPDDLKPLGRRQAAELRDTRWDADINELIGVLERVLKSPSEPEAAPRSAHRAVRDRSPWRWAVAALLVSIFALSAAAIFYVSNRSAPSPVLGSQTEPPTRAQGSETAVVPAETPAGNSSVPAQPVAPDTTRVPRVEGLTLQLAAQALRNAGLSVGTEQSVAAPGVSPFVVTKQTPAPGSFVPRNGRVDLAYARPGRILPALTGRSLDEAIAELRDSGFAPGILTARPTDKAPAQQVLEQSPDAGVALEPGTKVDLVYAAPQPAVAVPGVVGVEVSAAASMLQAAGLVVKSRRYRPTAEIKPGQVVSQEPAAGASVDKGTGVALVYASRRGLKVPAVKGLPIREAQSLLGRSGFTGRITYEATDGSRPDTVIRQTPLPDSPSTTDEPVVDLVVAQSLPSTLRLVIQYSTTADRLNAQNLATYLAPYKFASYDVTQVTERSILSGPGVHYARPEQERLAQSLASRSQAWLSKANNRPTTLASRLEPRIRGNVIVIYLPSQN